MLPLALQSQTYKGKLYSLAYYTGFFPIVLNRKMMKDASFNEPPRTFQGWVEQARTVKAKGLAEYPMVWPIKPAGWGSMYVWATMAAAKGGKLFDDKLEVTPVGLEVLSGGGRPSTTSCRTPPTSSGTTRDAAKVFSEGKEYMQWTMTIYAAHQYANSEKSKVKGNVVLVEPPETGATVGFAAGYGINAASKNKDAACKLVTFLGGKDEKGVYLTPKAWVELGALPPARRREGPGRPRVPRILGRGPRQASGLSGEGDPPEGGVPYQELWYFEWQEPADKQLQEVLAGMSPRTEPRRSAIM